MLLFLATIRFIHETNSVFYTMENLHLLLANYKMYKQSIPRFKSILLLCRQGNALYVLYMDSDRIKLQILYYENVSINHLSITIPWDVQLLLAP